MHEVQIENAMAARTISARRLAEANPIIALVELME